LNGWCSVRNYPIGKLLNHQLLYIASAFTHAIVAATLGQAGKRDWRKITAPYLLHHSKGKLIALTLWCAKVKLTLPKFSVGTVFS
jgi:hypothetical protein